MGFSCAPQLMGLVRGEPKSGQKHRANGRAIIAEAGDARVSKSVTLDRTRSYLNKYDGYANGFQAWDEMERQANEYQTTFTDKNGVVRNRKLKSDAVCGYAVIFNPPEEVCCEWDDATYKKFYEDSWSCLCKIEPRLFDDKNVLMDAEHFDEGIGDNDRHLHKFGIPKDENNKYCGNLLDAKLLSHINKNYPAMMRQRGWEMDDLDTTDWERYNEDEAYRNERKKKFRDNGKSVNKYTTDKLNEELKKAQNLTKQLEEDLSVVQQIREDAEEKEQRAKEALLTAEQIKQEALEQKKKNESEWEAILQQKLQLQQKEKNIIERENSVSAKEKEQQRKDDEFQRKEDAQEAQQKVLDAREQQQNERDLQQNNREKALQAQEHFQDVNNRANTTSVHRFDEYGNRI